MSYVERHTVSVTTDADGDATAYTPVVTGRVLNVIYTKDGTTPFDNGVDFDVTVESTGQVVWDEDDVNASATRSPRQPVHGTDGSASLFAGGGEPVEDYLWVGNDRIKIVVASGGDTKVGSFTVLIG